MAKLVFKFNLQPRDLQKVADGALRENIRKIVSDVGGQLQSARCKKHVRDLVVFLKSEGNDIRIQGFGPCCREFADSVNSLIKLPDGTTISILEEIRTYKL